MFWIPFCVVHFKVLVADESPIFHVFDNCSGEMPGVLLDVRVDDRFTRCISSNASETSLMLVLNGEGLGALYRNRCFYLLGLYCILANHHTFPLVVEIDQNVDPNCAHQINVPTGRSLFHLLLGS